MLTCLAIAQNAAQSVAQSAAQKILSSQNSAQNEQQNEHLYDVVVDSQLFFCPSREDVTTSRLGGR